MDDDRVMKKGIIGDKIRNISQDNMENGQRMISIINQCIDLCKNNK